MGFLKFAKKKDIPEELPSLAIEGIKEKMEDRKVERDSGKDVGSYFGEAGIKRFKPLEKTEYHGGKKEEAVLKREVTYDDEKSFFNDILKTINEEIGDMKKLEDWYNHKLLPHDIVHDMKEYWEKQKSGAMIQFWGKDFKEKLMERVNRLHELEKEWQGLYFEIVEKEEEMRKEERELKKLLSEFLDSFKKKAEFKKR
jgi:hypothetical protein